MAFQRSDQQQTRREINNYDQDQVRGVLQEIGLSIESETPEDYICFCPYHNNNSSPSFAISFETGLFFCFNPACNVTGNLMDLVQHVGDYTFFQAARLIKKAEVTGVSFADRFEKLIEEKIDFVPFDGQIIEDRHKDLWKHPQAVKYLTKDRGFTEETLQKFQIGYSAKRDLIMVPMHDPDGMPVGVIGRSPSSTNKVFKNSKGLPTSKTLFNYHRAKRSGGTGVIVEASFDAMRIDQAGTVGAMALLMGHFSKFHKQLVQRSFDKIIIMTDNDQPKFYDGCAKCRKRGLELCAGHRPGLELGNKIANELIGTKIYWSWYDKDRWPKHPTKDRFVKDPGEMTDDQIRQCLRNAKPNYEYQLLNSIV